MSNMRTIARFYIGGTCEHDSEGVEGNTGREATGFERSIQYT